VVLQPENFGDFHLQLKKIRRYVSSRGLLVARRPETWR
jgi:hypothetical protein